MKTKVLIIIIAFASSMAFGQKKLADKFFENYGYIKASELYEITVKKGDSIIKKPFKIYYKFHLFNLLKPN